MPRRLALLLAVLLGAGGVLVTAAGGFLAVRTFLGWQETERIRVGPRVLAVIVATRAPSSHRQPVTLRYRDRAGSRHTLDVAFPLGTARDVIPGMSTSVVYDPRSPAKAELAGHPRYHWQDALLAAGATAILTSVWLRWLLGLLRRAGEEARLRKAHIWGSLGVLAVLFLAGGRIGVAIVRDYRPQEVAFPPLPPKASFRGHAPPLAAVLSAPPPARGPLVTPVGARAIAEALWPVRDRALINRDVVTLRAIERDPALAVDLSRLTSGGAPNRIRLDARAPAQLRVYVPRQTHWPLRFLVEAATTSAGQPFLELMVVVRRNAHTRWQVTLDTGVTGSPGYTPHPDPSNEDAAGYDKVPNYAWIAADDVVPALALYWQAWIDTGKPPPRGPSFSPGTWTDRFAGKIAGTQGKRGLNGLPVHTDYGDVRVPPSEVWTFGVYGGTELACSPLLQTDTWTGPTSQDPDRQKWGWDLAPGIYRTVSASVVREPCVFVLPIPAPLAVIGADRWVVATRGRRK